MSRKIIFLLLPNTNLLDFAGASHVFHEAKFHGLDIEMKYCSYDKNITSSLGLPLGKIGSYKTQRAGSGDFIFIVSADIFSILSNKIIPDQGVLNWLKDAHHNGVGICAICNGAFILAMSGLLNGKYCTTHWKRTTELQKRFPLLKVVENVLFIEDKGIFTSAGATSGIDVALHILSKLKDHYFIYKVSRDLVIYNRRNGYDTQQSVYLNHRNHVHSGVHRVQDWLNENLYKKTSLFELAEIANMSARNFTRIFKKETTLTVNEYITRLRKEKINELMKNPDLSRTQIAQQCGLKSDRQVNRIMNN